jgi:signal transduction histidine kinase
MPAARAVRTSAERPTVAARWARVCDAAGETVGLMHVVTDVTRQARLEARRRWTALDVTL